MLKKITNSENKLILFIGLLSFAIGIIFNWYQLNSSPNNLQSPLLSKFSIFNVYFVLLFTIILAPLIEEFIFRSWTQGKRFSFLFSLSAITGFSYLILGSILTSAVIFFLLIISLFLIKNKIVIACVTSLIFAILHKENIGEGFHILTLLPLVGISLVFTYLALSYSLKTAIVGHSFYNVLAGLPLILNIGVNTDSIKFESESYHAKLDIVSPYSLNNDVDFISNDSMVIFSTLPEMIPSIRLYNNELFYESQLGSLQKYKLTVLAKPQMKIDRQDLIENILTVSSIESDTSMVGAFMLNFGIKNTSAKRQDIYNVRLYDFIDFIKAKKGIPLKLDQNYENQKISVSSKFLHENDQEQIIRLLNNEPFFTVSAYKKGEITQVILR